MVLNNGHTVWAVYWEINMPKLPDVKKGECHFFKGKTDKDLKNVNLRSMLLGSEPDGSKVIYDCAVVNEQVN